MRRWYVIQTPDGKPLLWTRSTIPETCWRRFWTIKPKVEAGEAVRKLVDPVRLGYRIVDL